MEAVTETGRRLRWRPLHKQFSEAGGLKATGFLGNYLTEFSKITQLSSRYHHFQPQTPKDQALLLVKPVYCGL